MLKWNIAAKPKEEQNKVNVDPAASGVAYKERMNTYKGWCLTHSTSLCSCSAFIELARWFIYLASKEALFNVC